MYGNYRPNHSDFLIHWTGKNIDRKYDPEWTKRSSSTTGKDVTQKYLKTLKGILKFGLWMTVSKESELIPIGTEKVKRLCPARTCFTESKLSSVRAHAVEYGRLGIGFKRSFVLDRMGSPMIYYNPKKKWRDNWLFPPYVGLNGDFKMDDYFACFLKPMVKEQNSPSDITMVYKYYDESEWRIIYCQELEDKLKQMNKKSLIRKIKKTSDFSDFADYVDPDCDVKPDYLIPVIDRWLAIIIYPSLAIKVEAEADKEIRDLLKKIKPEKNSSSRCDYKKPAHWEKYSKPIEMDLDACRNF